MPQDLTKIWRFIDTKVNDLTPTPEDASLVRSASVSDPALVTLDPILDTFVLVRKANGKFQYIGQGMPASALSDITTGTATLAAGTVTVANTKVTANSKIMVTHNTPNGTMGQLSVPQASRIAGTSFVINSDANTDAATVDYVIIG